MVLQLTKWCKTVCWRPNENLASYPGRCRRNSLATYPSSNCIPIWRQGDYSSTRTSHEYWIMHVIFDCSHMTVRNVQARCCCQQDSLQAYIASFNVCVPERGSLGHVCHRPEMDSVCNVDLVRTNRVHHFRPMMYQWSKSNFLHDCKIKSGRGLGDEVRKYQTLHAYIILMLTFQCVGAWEWC